MDPGSSPFEETQNQISFMFALTGRSWQPPQCTDWQILTTPTVHWLADLDNPRSALTGRSWQPPAVHWPADLDNPHRALTGRSWQPPQCTDWQILTTPAVHWLADLDNPRSALMKSKQHKRCRKCLHARSINTPHHLCRSREYYNTCPQPQCPAPTIAFLQEHGGATALDDTMGHDGDAVAQQVCLIHEVGGEQQRAASTVSLKDVPRLTPSSWVHPWCWLIQNNNLPGKKQRKKKVKKKEKERKKRLHVQLHNWPVYNLILSAPHWPKVYKFLL